MSRVLIVGAGLTGSVCACLLRRDLQDRVHIVMWDKARGVGGRMSTSRPPDPSCHSADLGAQYVTATPTYARKHSRFYSDLVSAGVLRPLDCVVEGLRDQDQNQNYVSPLGMSNVVKHFLSQSGADLFLERHVTGVFRRGASWEVQTQTGSEMFDAVVLTMPIPQILELQGDVVPLLSVSQQQQLSSVSYSSRFALALFFPPDSVLRVPWSIRYVTDSSVIVYMALKRTAGVGPSLVVHTSVPFGLQHLEEDKESVQPIILQELHKLLPDLPQPISTKCHKWRYSQVLTSVPDCPGHMTLLQSPTLILAGDAFIHSNLDGCIQSALSALTTLSEQLIREQDTGSQQEATGSDQKATGSDQ